MLWRYAMALGLVFLLLVSHLRLSQWVDDQAVGWHKGWGLPWGYAMALGLVFLLVSPLLLK